MRYFGKVVGFIGGFALGGFFVAILGAVAGHFLIDLPSENAENGVKANLNNIKDRVKTHIKYDISMQNRPVRHSWIGKISCTVLGLLSFGIAGAIIGLIIGHAIDIIRRRSDFTIFSFANNEDPFTAAAYSQEAPNVAFIQSMAALCAKLAKVDGQVSRSEVNAFKSLFSVPPSLSEKVGKTFNQAKETPAGFEVYALQLKNMFGQADKIYLDIINALFAIAAADGKVRPEEVSYISQVSAIFGISETVFAEILSSYHIYTPNPSRSSAKKPSDYEILGVSRTATKSEVRKAWLKLLRENHPDTLTAKGASAKEIKAANQRVASINAAYERISKGFK
ncbi:MAG: TerB family tellurite resistance protein [Alphaproteobacteria bacterium]|nr:TerB family tellurite resistance protein [Alphaproteobacteria bacterium]